MNAVTAVAKTARRGDHPTKTLLVDTTVTLLDTLAPEQLTADMVLEKSGVSRSSLYHHFEDFADLQEHALIRRFAAAVDESIEQLRGAMETANDLSDLRRLLDVVSGRIQDASRAHRRAQRFLVVAEAIRSARFRRTFGREQQRLTMAQADLFREGQARGWLRDDFDPHAAAVLVQAFTLGRVVDDVSAEPVDAAAWTALISSLIERLFVAK